jgi:hypothetical protein
VIDDDFAPDRRQLGALGILLVAHQNAPLMPAMREGELYRRMAGNDIGSDREPWLNELAERGLIRLADTGFRAGDRIGQSTVDVCLTPAGIFYYVSRAQDVAMQAQTPLDDFPAEIVDAPWVIQSYFSPSDVVAPSADGFVRFDHNEAAFDDALTKLNAVFEALKSDNEIGSESPDVRDEKLDELRLIRSMLEKREGWRFQLLSTAFVALCFISSEFATRPVGYLAEQAWIAIQVMLGMK